MNILTKEECLNILNNNKTPSKVILHSKAVCKVAEKIADSLIKRKIKINKKLVIAAAMLHDVERGRDKHVAMGIKLLKNLGYPEVANVVKKHSLYKLEVKNRQPATWEEKIVFYADKRCVGNKVVSVEERFGTLEKYYKVNLSKELKFTKNIEKELLENKKYKLCIKIKLKK